MEPVETSLDQTSAVTQFWNAHPEALFTQVVLTAITGLSPAYFERGRWAGYGPKFFKLGRLVRYKKKDVVCWLEKLPAGVHHASAVLSATEAAEKLASEKKLEQARGDFTKQKARATKVKRRVSGVTRPPQAEV